MERMEIAYKQSKRREWLVLPYEYTSNKVDRELTLSDLQSSTSYELKITAVNQADATQALYTFQTSSKQSGKIN